MNPAERRAVVVIIIGARTCATSAEGNETDTGGGGEGDEGGGGVGPGGGAVDAGGGDALCPPYVEADPKKGCSPECDDPLQPNPSGPIFCRPSCFPSMDKGCAAGMTCFAELKQPGFCSLGCGYNCPPLMACVKGECVPDAKAVSTGCTPYMELDPDVPCDPECPIEARSSDTGPRYCTVECNPSHPSGWACPARTRCEPSVLEAHALGDI